MHSNKLRLIVLSSIYAFAYLQSYGKQFVMSKPYSSRAFNFGVPDEPRGRVGMPLCMQQVFWLIARLLSLPSLSVDNWQLASDLDTKQTILQITAAGLCRNFTCFPKSECGCKGNTFYWYVQEKIVFFALMLTELFFLCESVKVWKWFSVWYMWKVDKLLHRLSFILSHI